jgi:hypothetical protein
MTVYLILQSLISTYISRLQLNIVYEVNYIIVAFTKLLHLKSQVLPLKWLANANIANIVQSFRQTTCLKV